MPYIDLRLMPGFENEDVFTLDNQAEVDVEKLSAEIESQQEVIFKSTNAFNSALESMRDLENVVQEIEVGTESDIDLVSANLLLNKIRAQEIKLLGKESNVAGLESNNPKIALESGLEAATGMIASIKEFIVKIWTKIKDAFKFIWSKMKEFWAWIAGSDKKVEEKIEETVVAAAAAEAAETKSEDIKEAKEDITKTKDSYERFKRRQAMKKGSESGKLNTDVDSDDFMKTTTGKFKGRKIASLSKEEFDEWMREDKKNEEIVIDAVIEDIIIEEVSRKTKVSEEKIKKAMPTKIMQKLIVSAYDPKYTDRVVDIINSNIEKNKEAIAAVMTKTLFLSITDNAIRAGFAYSPMGLFDDYAEYKKNASGEEGNFTAAKLAIKRDIDTWASTSISDMLNIGLKTDNLVGSLSTVTSAILCSTLIIDTLNNVLNRHWDPTNETQLTFKKTTGPFPMVFTDVSIVGNKISTTYFNVFEKETMVFDDINVSEIGKFKMDKNILATLSTTTIGSSAKSKGAYKGISDIQTRLDHLLKFSDDALKTTLDNSKKYDEDKNWIKVQSNLVKMINNVAFLNPSVIINMAKANNTMLNTIINSMGIKDAINQASNDFK